MKRRSAVSRRRVPRAVLDAVREARGPNSAPVVRITVFEDVLAVLKNKVPDDRILEGLKESPTVFTLDTAQVAKLKRAGAADRLLEALQGLRPPSPRSISNIAIILDCSNSMNLPASRSAKARDNSNQDGRGGAGGSSRNWSETFLRASSSLSWFTGMTSAEPAMRSTSSRR